MSSDFSQFQVVTSLLNHVDWRHSSGPGRYYDGIPVWDYSPGLHRRNMCVSVKLYQLLTRSVSVFDHCMSVTTEPQVIFAPEKKDITPLKIHVSK